MGDVTNEDRADWALIALQAFADRTNQSGGEPLDRTDIDNIDEILGDLLGDLRHLVGPEIYGECCARGSAYYHEELEEAKWETRNG